MFNRKFAYLVCATLALVWVALSVQPKPAEAGHFTNWLNIFAPFNGTWNFENNAPPSSHHRPWGGDWATDYYAPQGTQGWFFIANSIGGTAYGVVSGKGGSCANPNENAGWGYTISVYDGTGYRGWYLIAHVRDYDPNGDFYQLYLNETLVSGRTVGWMHWRSNTGSGCYVVYTHSGVHWHLEFQQPVHYACYAPYAQDTALTTSDFIGAVGSNALGFGAPCWVP